MIFLSRETAARQPHKRRDESSPSSSISPHPKWNKVAKDVDIKTNLGLLLLSTVYKKSSHRGTQQTVRRVKKGLSLPTNSLSFVPLEK